MLVGTQDSPSLSRPHLGSYATETLESLPLAAGSHASLKTSGTGVFPLQHGGPVVGHEYSSQSLPVLLGGLWDLEDPFSPLRQLGAAQECWPWPCCLPLLSHRGCLVLVVLVVGWGSLQVDLRQSPGWKGEKPGHPQSSPRPISHCSLRAEKPQVLCLWSPLPLPNGNPWL